MATSTVNQAGGRPLALDALISRYDPEVVDLDGATVRIRLASPDGEWDAVLRRNAAEIVPAAGRPDAEISAGDTAWRSLALDIEGGLDHFHAGRLRIRRNLHHGISFLAATSGRRDPERLRFRSHRISSGRISTMEAGAGDPLVCIPGLGGTKASFMTTVASLAPERRVIAIDLPGFGDSDKPVSGRYDAAWFANRLVELLDELGLERADLIGNSMGGRVAIEVGLRHPDRAGRLVLLSPAMAWLRRDRTLDWLLRAPLPLLGLLQPAPRAIVEPIVRRLIPSGNDGWIEAGLDEFLRSYCTAPGRFAFYESARNIARDEPHGEDGLWQRLEGLEPETMFVWGRADTLVPIGFMKHVERALPAARHLELDCGHVPQLEASETTHRAVSEFLAPAPRPRLPRFRLRR
jgi:pimeloyl-ACP methyl ester carboxylesterase